MTEQEVRELVRAAIARHRGSAPLPAAAAPCLPVVHVSHHRFDLPAGEGPCLVEPAVPCSHCGFCQSYGH